MPAAMRSGTTECSVGESRSTPWTTRREVPAPSMRAPIDTSISAMSTISGSLATLSIRVVPRARTEAVRTFSVAPTLGKSSRMSAPVEAVGRLRDEVAVGHVDGGAERLEPGGVQVETARADRVAARDGDVGQADPGDERAEHRDRGPQGAHQLVVGAVAELLGHVEHDGAGQRVVVDGHAEASQQLRHDRHVGDRRHVGQGRAAGREERHRHQLEGAVLGADDGDLARQPGSPHDTEALSHPATLPIGPGERVAPWST